MAEENQASHTKEHVIPGTEKKFTGEDVE